MPISDYEYAKRLFQASTRSEQTIIEWNKPKEGDGQTEIERRLSLPSAFEGGIHGRVANADVVRSKKGHFGSNSSSYKIKTPPVIEQDSSDIFLYGHSTWRTYSEPKSRGSGAIKEEVRGISAEKKFVSASKVADYLDAATQRKGPEKPVRVWIFSCHSAGDDLEDADEVFAKAFAHKLAARGWRSAQIIGFEKAVTALDLGGARIAAYNTPLDQRFKLPKVRSHAYGSSTRTGTSLRTFQKIL